MVRGDIVVAPLFHCKVAEEAQRVRHDVVKNRLLLFDDDLLADWVRDDAQLQGLESSVRWVCSGMRGFSASGLVQQLRPLTALAPNVRERLVAALDRLFEDEFQPEAAARHVAHCLDAFLDSVRRLTTQIPGKSDEAEQLSEVRERARMLGLELATLPEGFCMPRGQSSTQTVGNEA